MKKYLKIMILVLVVGFITTGCMEEKISMVVNNDKSMDFNMYLSVDLKKMQDLADSFGGSNEEVTDEEYLNCLEENDWDETNCIEPSSSSSSSFDVDDIKDSMDEEAFKELEDRGFKVTQNITSDKMEVNVSKTYNNIDDISSNEDVTFDMSDESEKYFKVEKGFLEDKYTFHMLNDSQNISDDSNSGLNFDTENIDPSLLSGMVDMSFQITLPNGSISNNATSISDDKKTLTWDLIANENKDILVTFALPNANKNLIIYGGIGIGVLLVLIILIVIISKNKKKKADKPQIPVANVTTEPNVMPNQGVVNQNPEQVVEQTINNGPVPMPINGEVALGSVNQVANETVVPVAQQPIGLTSEPIMPSASVVDALPVMNDVPVEPTPVVDAPPVMTDVPVEPTPVVDAPPVMTDVPKEPTPVNTTSQSINENDVNKINSDLQNMALNILSHNNDNN